MDVQTQIRKGKPRAGAKKARVLDITVLMGGPSSERDVSFESGQAIADALARRGHRVTPSDISPADVSALDRRGIDVVFIALHGAFGESGEVQDLCEARGLRYTGSGPAASRLAMDKAAAKERFRLAGVHVPEGVVVAAKEPADTAARAVAALGLPAVIKPVDGGSSVDVTITDDPALRDQAIRDVVGKYGQALVEQFIKGRELTVGILGEEPLPIIQIIPDGRFYDKFAKYHKDSKTQYILDHGLDAATCRRLQAEALAAYRSLGCRDMSRVDFLLPADGTPYCLELNNIPGFTSHSLLPKAAQQAGIGFDELVQRLVDMAMARPAGRRQR